MIYSIPKGLEIKLGDTYVSEDFDCHCISPLCTTTIIHKTLIVALDAMSKMFEAKLILTSVYRCLIHNSAVGGVATSQHMQGTAVDIVCPDGMSIEMFAHICRQYFNFVLVYKNKNVCHCDVR